MKVLVTRPLAQADSFAAALRQAGFEPVPFPVIQIRPAPDPSALAQALSEIRRYAWVVFTSVNAVEVVCEFLQARSQSSQAHFNELPIAAIGPKTAQALRGWGIDPTFVPAEYVAEAILTGLGDLNGKWVLLPRAEVARKALPAAITAAGGYAHEVTVYHTLPVEPAPEGLAALRTGVDWVTFTSPSTVQNFCQVVRANDLDPLALPGKPCFACIGPITAQAARQAGFPLDAVAVSYTIEGLIQAIKPIPNLSSGKANVEKN